MNIPPVPRDGGKGHPLTCRGVHVLLLCHGSCSRLSQPGAAAQSPVCAGAATSCLSLFPGVTAASLQRGWAPVLARWSNWFAGRKQRSCSRHDRGHIAVPSLPVPAALPSQCWKRLNWEDWEPEGQGQPGHRCVQLWQGARVAVSSKCHLLARPAARKVAETHAEPRLGASGRTPGDREGQG